MKKIVKEFEVFTFDELEKSVQKELIEKYRYTYVDGWDWYSWIYDDFEYGDIYSDKNYCYLYNRKINGFDIYYKTVLFSCDIDIEKFILTNNLEKEFSSVLEHLKDNDGNAKVYNEHDSNQLELDIDIDNETHKALFNAIAEDLNDIKKYLFKTLNDEYEHLTSDDSVKDYFIHNEIEFLSDGTQFKF